MEPRIQYATAKDGVRIAFSTLGEGMPFVHTPSGTFHHAQLEWHIPEMRRWHERLAEKRKLVRYDGRGSGLSDRDIAEYSLEGQVMDLEAVADGLRLERFALFGFYHGGPAAIAYTARHPDRVSHLILWQSWARAQDRFTGSPQVEAVRALLEKDWQLYTETLCHTLMGWDEGEPARRFASFIRECSTQKEMIEFNRSTDEFDVTPLLAQVTTPTLVLHRRQFTRVSIELARGLASRIPSARLLMLEGTAGVPFLGDTESVLQAIDEFLSGSERGASQRGLAEPVTLRTVLFTDLVAHTEMMQRLGDERGREVLREHETITRNVLKQHGGTEVKTMGDGFMASFGSVTRAVECAVALQGAFGERDGEPLSVRVGLNAGEPIEEDGDLFGATVILASRIAAKADGGEILVADTVRGLCSGKGFLFADRGEFVAKGFEEPVRVYEVRWRE